jgi:hypothetical protein
MMTNARFAKHHPCKKCAKRKGHIKKLAGHILCSPSAAITLVHTVAYDVSFHKLRK